MTDAPTSDVSANDDVVLYDVREPGIALLTLNRPTRLNAWNGAMAERYFDLLDRAAADPEVKVIVVTGAGKGYCAGADLTDLKDIGGGAVPRGQGLMRDQFDTVKVPKPVIAAINGAAAGMGLAQALMCDIRFASRTAKLTTAFGQRGLIAEWGLSWTLPRIVGTGRALDLLYSGRVVSGEEAAAMGLVNEAVDGDALLDHTLAYAANLARTVAPTSMAVIKRQVYDDWDKDLYTAHADAVRLMQQSFRRSDVAEGVASFLDKRPPRFGPVDPNA